ncbi:hypothetical protein BT96DRAFT_926082 [Gymnopus androsaceus JB14]|uniref:Uncharacterized protein n=1 Tax=Gymnopus androsaceus JB14 TaxID=1447944 RepID=A0A6A4GYL1_9AGAR|nr:hypothetical protein BT96DRAFT_926082 [Gymnopus androsaceus JB14]
MKRRSMDRRKELHIADRTVSGVKSVKVDQDHHDYERSIPTISVLRFSPPQIPPPSSRPIVDVETATTSCSCLWPIYPSYP